MGTLTGLLHSTANALLADQKALSATAENVANQNTVGYVRRSVSWSEGDTVMVKGTATSTGVTATVVAQRDNVLLRNMQQATSSSSASTARSAALNNLQSLFTIDKSGADASGIGAAVTNLFSSLNSLASSPSDVTAQQTAYNSAQTLAATMNRAASELTAQVSSLNQQVSSSVAQANSLLSSIASLNQQISQVHAGDNTDTLQDERDLVITKLSQLMDVNSIRNADGSVSLSLSDGTPVVSGGTASPLSTAMVSGTAQVMSGGTNVTAMIHGGSIGGMLQVRDSDIPAVRGQLDAIASSIASAVNAQNALGTDASGSAGGNIFSGTTAATLSVAIRNGGGFGSSSDGSNAAALGALASVALVGGQTSSDAFSTLLTNLGQSVSSANTTQSADSAVLTQTSNQLAALSSVSLDTEAANLTQYQRSYEAAAKVLAIVNQLMADAINLGTATAVN